MKADPAVAEAGAETTNCLAAPGVTAIGPLVPVTAEVKVSVAVMVRLPALLRVTGKVPAPLVRVELAGRAAAASDEVKWTVPE